MPLDEPDCSDFVAYLKCKFDVPILSADGIQRVNGHVYGSIFKGIIFNFVVKIKTYYL